MSDNRTTELRISEPLRGFIKHQSNRAYIDGGQSRWLTKIADEIDAKHEQAIAATLERGTLTAEQVREAIEANSWAETSTIREFNDSSCQAIADELNAELGSGNCARCAEDMGRYADSLCDPLKERIAELLRCLENDWHIHASWDGLRKFWCIELTEEGVRMRDAMHGTLTADDIRGLIERHSDESGGNGRDFHNGAYVAIADELNARAERTCEFKPFRNDTNEEGERQGVCSVCNAYMHEQFCFCQNCGAKVVNT